MLKRRLSSQAGQALVIAVLLLILMAVLSAVFVAFVAHSIAQAGRRVDVEAAERMSVAGVLFAHRQLLTSPDQASWRPVMPTWYNPMLPEQYYSPAEISRGFAMNFPPYVKIDDPIASGDDPFAMGSAGEQQLGRCLLQVSYVPSYWYLTDPRTAVAYPWGTWIYPTDRATGLFDELSPFIKITAVGSARQQPDLMRTKVAYVPVVLPDRLATIVDSEETYRWASFGTPPWVDINGDGLLDGWEDTNNDGVCEAPNDTVSAFEAREFGVGRIYGGVHSNTSLVWYGRTWLDELRGDRQFLGVGNAPGNGGRGDRVSVAGNIAVSNPPFGNQPANWECGARLNWCNPIGGVLEVAGVYPSRLPSGGGPAPTWDHASPAALPNSPTPAGGPYVFPVFAGYVQDNLGLLEPSVDDAVRASGFELDVNRRMAQRVRAGLLDASDEAGNVRLRGFARDSGWRFEILAGSGTPQYPAGAYNTAQFGLGNTLYVDNDEDVQALDPQALHDNWMHAGAQADAFWYGPVYVPPGCEVTLYERDVAANWTASPPADAGPPPPQRRYGNRPELPDIEIRRSPTPSGAARSFSVPVTGDAGGNRLADAADVWNPLTMPTGAITGILPLDIDPADGVPDDRIIVDYPADGCLYFEGNVRVQGRLPISRMDVLDGTGFPRRFDLSLVSRQTIYIDGNLMRGLDWLPPVTVDGNGVVTGGQGYPPYIRQDRYCARAALMAEHNVVVNATRGEYQGPGIETDCEYIPDVAEAATRDGHWLLEPGKSFRTYFGFGGVDLSHPSWLRNGNAPPDNPLSPARDAITGWRDDVFLKLRVRGSRLSAFNLLVNGQPYDFDTRPLNWSSPAGVPYTFAEAPGVSPCRQMDGTLQTLYIPLLINGAPANLALSGAGAWGAPAINIDGLPGNLNSVEIRPSLGMTYPLEVYGVSLERRDSVGVAPAPLAGPASGVPLLASDQAHPWFSWSPENGPPPLVRAGGDVLQSRVMTVAACSYAQKGSFFIIGGDFFDRQAAQVDRNGDGLIIAASLGHVDASGIWGPSDVDFDRSGTPDWAEDRRHNLQVEILGAVNENLPPDITCLADWTDKLSFPVPDLLPAVTQGANGYAPTVAFWSLDAATGRLPTGWCGPIMAYDPGLRASNPVDPAPNPIAPGALNTQTVCRLPRIPVSPDLIYFGDLAR
jgi:hypothetical protein